MLFRRLAIATAAVLAMGGLIPVAQAQTGDPSFNLVNRSSRVIYEAYASPSSDSNWGQDRLGQNIVPGGAQLRHPPAAGRMHLRRARRL